MRPAIFPLDYRRRTKGFPTLEGLTCDASCCFQNRNALRFTSITRQKYRALVKYRVCRRCFFAKHPTDKTFRAGGPTFDFGFWILDFGFFDPHSAFRIPYSIHGDAIVRDFHPTSPCHPKRFTLLKSKRHCCFWQCECQLDRHRYGL